MLHDANTPANLLTEWFKVQSPRKSFQMELTISGVSPTEFPGILEFKLQV